MPVPSKLAEGKIRRLLCMPKNANWMRCPARSKSKVQRFESEGNFDHSAAAHVCEECRCRRVAGSGTKGDFYGIGEECGHYGVGFCSSHEVGKRKQVAAKFAENQMSVLQQFGIAPVREMALRGQKLDEEASRLAIKAREGIHELLRVIDEFRELCISGALTETASGTVIKASDKTRFELAAKLAKSVSELAKDQRIINDSDYVHIDELRVRMPQMMDLALRFIPAEDDRKKFISGLRYIWDSTKTGSK